MIVTWVQAEGGKGGITPARECQQTQERDAGCREKRQRMAGGRGGKRPVGRRFAPGEEVERGCKQGGTEDEIMRMGSR